MDLHKLAPGIPDRLSSVPPLLTLLKNHRLLKQFAVTSVDQAQNQPPCSNITFEKQIKRLTDENAELRDLVAYGMQLLKGKDEEIKFLKQSLQYMSQSSYSGNNGSLKNIGNNKSKAICNHVNILYGEKDKKKSSKTNNSFVNVKSSGYGRRAVPHLKKSGNAEKPNFIKRNKMQILKHKMDKEAANKRKSMTSSSAVSASPRSSSIEKDSSANNLKRFQNVKSSGYGTTSVTTSQIASSKTQMEVGLVSRKQPQSSSPPSQREKRPPATRHCQQAAPPCPLPAMAPAPPSPGAVSTALWPQSKARANSRTLKATRRSAQTEVHTQSISTGQSSLNKAGFTTTIALAKPNAWAKFYICEDKKQASSSVLEDGNSMPPPLPLRERQASEQSPQDRRLRPEGKVRRSSAGRRNFLAGRRAEGQVQKPSSSFASSVPRFEITL